MDNDEAGSNRRLSPEEIRERNRKLMESDFVLPKRMFLACVAFVGGVNPDETALRCAERSAACVETRDSLKGL